MAGAPPKIKLCIYICLCGNISRHEENSTVPQRTATQEAGSHIGKNRRPGRGIDPARHRRLSRKGESEMTMRRAREQSGYIYKRGGWWVLRYRENVLDGGQLVRRQLARQIEPVRPEHMRLKRPPPEIQHRANAILQPLNSHAYPPHPTQTLTQFAETRHSPHL